MRQILLGVAWSLAVLNTAVHAADSGDASAIEPVHLSPTAPVWGAEDTTSPQRHTVFQNPQNIDPNALNQGFQQGQSVQQGSRPVIDATRETLQNIDQWGTTTARDLGQGTRDAATGVVNGVRDTLQATGRTLGNVVDNTLNVGNDNYYGQRQGYELPASQTPTTVTPPSLTHSGAPAQGQQMGSQPVLQQPFTGSNQGVAQATGPVQQNPQSATGPQFDLPLRFSDSGAAATQQDNGFQATLTGQARPSRVEPVQPYTVQQPTQDAWDRASAPQQQQPAQQPPQFVDNRPVGTTPTQFTTTAQSNGQGAAQQGGGGTTDWGFGTPATQTTQGQQQSQFQTPPYNTAQQNGAGAGQLPAYTDPNRVNFALDDTTQPQEPTPQVASTTPIMLGVGLIGSLAFNLFVGTSYLDVRNKYRSALRRSPRDLRAVA